MNTFTARRALHQQATAAEVTGEVPLAAMLCDDTSYGGDTGCAAQEQALGYRAWMFGWAGNLDAPEHILTGGVRVVYIDPNVGGMGFEGIACCNALR
jgi:hypothetical protein